MVLTVWAWDGRGKEKERACVEQGPGAGEEVGGHWVFPEAKSDFLLLNCVLFG